MNQVLNGDPIQPVRPFAPYIGGKRALSRRLVDLIERVPHEIREIFAGFAIEEVGLNYRVSGKVTPARELIITGGGG